jgi:hypothetical protein
MPALRIVVRGFGQVEVSRIVLKNGPTTYSSRRRTSVVGRKAPRTGFPNFDFQTNRGALPITFDL